MKVTRKEETILKYINIIKDRKMLEEKLKMNSIHLNTALVNMARKGIITKGKAVSIIGIDNPCIRLIDIPLKTQLTKTITTRNENIKSTY